MKSLTNNQLVVYSRYGLYKICKRIHQSLIGKPGESLTQVQLLERYNYLQHRMMCWKMPSQQGAKWDRLMYLMVQCALDEAFEQIENPRTIEPEAVLSRSGLEQTPSEKSPTHQSTRSHRGSTRKLAPKSKRQ